MAIAGPALLAVLVALYVGRPAIVYLATGSTLAILILACDAWIVVRRRWITGAFALATHIAFVAFLFGYAASPLPMPSTLSSPLPGATPPAGMAVYAIPTGANHRTARGYDGIPKWSRAALQ